jgi:thiamine-monophosphate kinase
MSRLVEDETLERIRHTLENGIEAGGLRDDAAVLAVPGGGPVVVSVDSVVDGVHVDLALCSPRDVGWKALMGALSDLAAMGARPIGALVALCVPEAAGGGEVTLGVMEGVAEASQASGCPVVGGDVSAAGVLVVSVTVMGTLDGGRGGRGPAPPRET